MADVPPADPEDPAVDAAMAVALASTPPEAWDELAAALADVDRLAADAYATWDGAEGRLPYPEYAPEVERLWAAVSGAGLVVPYAWPQWEGIGRYRGGDGMAAAPVEDAVRMLTAIIRSERFGDGNIDGALRNGTFQAAVRRVLAWSGR